MGADRTVRRAQHAGTLANPWGTAPQGLGYWEMGRTGTPRSARYFLISAMPWVP